MDKLITKEAKQASNELHYGPVIDCSFKNYKKKNSMNNKTRTTEKAKKTGKKN